MFILVILKKDGSPREKAHILKNLNLRGIEREMNEMGWERQGDRWRKLTKISEGLFEYSETAIVLSAKYVPEKK